MYRQWVPCDCNFSYSFKLAFFETLHMFFPVSAEVHVVLSLFDLNILLNSGRHQMLSKLSSLSISSLRKLDDEANKFYDRKHGLYEAALLTRCFTQH